MRFWVDEAVDPKVAGVRSGPEAVCWQGHEECSDWHGGPCSTFPCTCDTDGRCLSCTGVRSRR